MKKFVLILLAICTSLAGMSQNAKKGQTVQGLKIAYITRELSLTTDEAQIFWPVYYSYFDEMKKTRQETKDDVLAFDEKILFIKKKYSLEFKKVLGTDERANKVFLADRNFGAIIRKEIMARQKNRG